MANLAPHMANAAGPLANLRDIHLPAPVSAWPPAPGWFILAGLTLAAACALVWWLVRRWRAGRYRREALAELQALRDTWQQADDPTAYLERFATLLKRIALTRYPRETVASLTGEAWVDFLDRSAGTREFSMGAGQVLIDGNYRGSRPGREAIDVPALHELGKHWIKRHREARA